MSRSRYVIYVSSEDNPLLTAWLESMPKGSRSDQICALLSWAISSPLSGQAMPVPVAAVEASLIQRKRLTRAAKPSQVQSAPTTPEPAAPVHEAADVMPSHVVGPTSGLPPPAMAESNPDGTMDALDLMWNIGG